MPRDLIDLMENATRSAPPEPHDPAAITGLAARRLRRRTTGIAGGVALAVVVAGAAGLGLTRGHDSAPEPADRYRHDVHVDFGQAVPASRLRGYTLEPWTVDSLHAGIPTYDSVDASGRLLTIDAPDGDALKGPFRVRLYDAPGAGGRTLRGPRPASVTWIPRLLPDGRLLWRANSRGSRGSFPLTDRQGDLLASVPSRLHVAGRLVTAGPEDVSGGSVWLTSGSDVYRASFDGQASRVGAGAELLVVGDGAAGWLTTKGGLVVQADSGAAPVQVPVPLDEGCRPVPARLGLEGLAVSGTAVAITEQCGTGDGAPMRLLVLDLSGQVLGRITGVTPIDLAFAGDSLLFAAEGRTLRYDLVTGTLASLGPVGRVQAPPQGAGDYVRWYDRKGGHVARFAD